jgi:hypothetical protein
VSAAKAGHGARVVVASESGGLKTPHRSCTYQGKTAGLFKLLDSPGLQGDNPGDATQLATVF